MADAESEQQGVPRDGSNFGSSCSDGAGPPGTASQASEQRAPPTRLTAHQNRLITSNRRTLPSHWNGAPFTWSVPLLFHS